MATGFCSAAANVLALTGPLYMLKIYNDVLPSGSPTRLAAMTLAMLGLYGLSGLFDFARTRLMGRAALKVDRLLSGSAFAIQQRMALTERSGDAGQPVRDLDQIRAFVASTGPAVVFDLPWMPVYLGVIWVLHPLLGAAALVGALALVGLMLMAEAASRTAMSPAFANATRRWSFAAAARRDAEATCAMGQNLDLQRRWSELDATHRKLEHDGARWPSAIIAAIKAARPALQSAMLGLGAYLFLAGEASAGAMLAASIILSRALAPLEAAITHWRGFVGAHQSYHRLSARLASLPPPMIDAVRPETPRNRIAVEQVAVGPPGRPAVVHGVSFTLQAGDALGIIGPSGSGKSTLARGLIGAWGVSAGSILLDETALTAWHPDALGSHIGYMPQDVTLLPGSIADNISRFDKNASEIAVTAAARAAGVHELVLRLEHGYATQVADNGSVLSAGQRQRIALARALYGDPFLVVLDEPNANLDDDGDARLTAAIASVRRRGGIAIVIAHRRSALAAIDKVLALANRRVVAIGPTESVLARANPAAPAARVPLAAAE